MSSWVWALHQSFLAQKEIKNLSNSWAIPYCTYPRNPTSVDDDWAGEDVPTGAPLGSSAMAIKKNL